MKCLTPYSHSLLKLTWSSSSQLLVLNPCWESAARLGRTGLWKGKGRKYIREKDCKREKDHMWVLQGGGRVHLLGEHVQGKLHVRQREHKKLCDRDSMLGGEREGFEFSWLSQALHWTPNTCAGKAIWFRWAAINQCYVSGLDFFLHDGDVC